MVQVNLLAMVATASSSQYTPWPGGGIIAWVICNARKRQELGGWLLYYYWQLYAGLVLTAIFFVAAFQSYVPESFDDHKRYILFLSSTVPVLILFAVQLAIATILISVRSSDLLKLLRWVMVAELVASSMATIIDIKFFPDNLTFDFLTIAPLILWLAYFFKSRRVRHVFQAHDWDSAVNVIYPSRPTLAT